VQREKKDRRTRKTRQTLRGALLTLLKEKRYEDITVQDIIERADVARSTFYIHYLDKDDLLTGQHGIFAENLGHDLSAHSVDGGSGGAFSSRAWFYHIQAQGDILKLIAKDTALDMVMKTLRGIILRSVDDGLRKHPFPENPSVPRSLVVDYLTDTLMALIKWWFQDGMKYTPEQMDVMFNQLATPGVLAVLKGVDDETH